MEVITKITDTNEGYDVVTSKQTIRLRIDMDQNCCETAGYFLSEDDISSFIGSELTSIRVVDDGLRTYDVEAMEYLDSGGVMFVNLETNRGTLQFVAYNAHNGYYAHAASVDCIQLKHEDYL